MYSQLIVTCLWSVPAQKKNKQFFQLINAEEEHHFLDLISLVRPS